MIQVCSRCGTRWNVRDRQRVWCPRCNGTLLAPSRRVTARRSGARVRPHPPCARAVRRRQTGPPRLPPGYRWIAVRPGAAPPPAAGDANLGPTPRYAGDTSLGSRRAIRHRRVRAAGRAAPRALDRRAARHADRDDRGARPCRARTHGAIRAADHQPRCAVESGGGVVGDLVRSSGQRGRPVPGVRHLRVADELAHRPAIGGVQTRWAPRTPTALGAARRLPGAVRQLGMGTGLRSRTGQRRRRPSPPSPADRGVVGGVGAVHRGVGVLHRDQLHHAMPRASRTTR